MLTVSAVFFCTGKFPLYRSLRYTCRAEKKCLLPPKNYWSKFIIWYYLCSIVIHILNFTLPSVQIWRNAKLEEMNWKGGCQSTYGNWWDGECSNGHWRWYLFHMSWKQWTWVQVWWKEGVGCDDSATECQGWISDKMQPANECANSDRLHMTFCIVLELEVLEYLHYITALSVIKYVL